ncbi:MAG: OmpH family outer membrane protein [Tannerella sp.]|jgi:outer membrane protein|nr:OmpH family outer membrane protein [Tannerella sp.]
MKTTLKFVLVIAIVAFCSNVSAQALKLAHINMQELIVSMSEYDTAMVKMQKVTRGLESELETLNVERNKKIEEYTTNSKNWTDLVRQSKEQELQSINQRIQLFQEQAQESLQQENDKLMQPVLEKANKAIETVAKEQGITYVLSSQAVLYKAIDSVDLLPAVKQHMGIKK